MEGWLTRVALTTEFSRSSADWSLMSRTATAKVGTSKLVTSGIMGAANTPSHCVSMGSSAAFHAMSSSMFPKMPALRFEEAIW